MDNKVALITLGCSKNTVEAEAVAGLFVKDGFEITNDVQRADIIVIHTCSFIADAQIESENCIIATKELKAKNKNLKIYVSGCLPQLMKQEFIKKYPFVDGCVGTGDFEKIVKLIKKQKFFSLTKECSGVQNFKRRILSTSIPSTYIKISEGCNHRCSFCLIPQVRGNYKSRTIKSVVDEAKALAACGIKELNIIAQDTTSYGIDIYGKPVLDRLLDKISNVSSLKWIRLLYAYPLNISNDLLKIIYERENICKYIDIPIQHIDKQILAKMARPLNTVKVIENIKNKFPDITLRTSLIVGFPGETKTQFNNLANFVRQNYFEHIGIFGYSDQKKAKSFKLKNKISQKVIEERKQTLAAVQFENVIKNNKAKIGKEFEVFVEAVDKNFIYCRTSFQAPEIDNITLVRLNKTNKRKIKIGTFTKIMVSNFKDYDLIGRLED